MSRPDLAFVIVCHNHGAWLRACLDSIVDKARGRAWEAVVVDNASTDGGADEAGRFPERLSLIRNPSNLGFARAANQGFRASTAPLVLFLDPDTRLLNDAPGILADFLDENHRVAAAGPSILDDRGVLQSSARRFPDLGSALFHRRAWLTRRFPGNPGSKAYLKAPPDRRPDWLSGAAIMVRREALEAAGGFDEGYFLYVEDVDLCRRFRNAGWDIAWVADARVEHRGGNPERPPRLRRLLAHHRGMWRYYRKHLRKDCLRDSLVWLGILGRLAWHSLR